MNPQTLTSADLDQIDSAAQAFTQSLKASKLSDPLQVFLRTAFDSFIGHAVADYQMPITQPKSTGVNY